MINTEYKRDDKTATKMIRYRKLIPTRVLIADNNSAKTYQFMNRRYMSVNIENIKIMRFYKKQTDNIWAP